MLLLTLALLFFLGPLQFAQFIDATGGFAILPGGDDLRVHVSHHTVDVA